MKWGPVTDHWVAEGGSQWGLMVWQCPTAPWLCLVPSGGPARIDRIWELEQYRHYRDTTLALPPWKVGGPWNDSV